MKHNNFDLKKKSGPCTSQQACQLANNKQNPLRALHLFNLVRFWLDGILKWHCTNSGWGLGCFLIEQSLDLITWTTSHIREYNESLGALTATLRWIHAMAVMESTLNLLVKKIKKSQKKSVQVTKSDGVLTLSQSHIVVKWQSCMGKRWSYVAGKHQHFSPRGGKKGMKWTARKLQWKKKERNSINESQDGKTQRPKMGQQPKLS